MNTLSVYLEDCYGIGRFDETFDFSIPAKGSKSHQQTSVIYAHNGVMKTSFANTFYDISQKKDPYDAVLKRVPKVRVEADGKALNPDSVFVVASHSSYFETEKMMTLLADKTTQQRYVEIMEEINDATTALFESVAKKIGLTGADKADKAKQLFDARFKTNDETRLTHIISMVHEVGRANPDLLKVNYKVLNDTKVEDFLKKESTHEMLQDYVTTYERLIKASKYFDDDLYDYNNASEVQGSMKKNNFMKAKNRVVLVAKDGTETPVSSIEELEALYADDKGAIFEDLTLKKKYEAFDKEIGINPSMRGFQDWVKVNQDFIPSLRNLGTLKQRTWEAYFGDVPELYDMVVRLHTDNKEELETIYAKSLALESEWQAVVDNFNDSFFVPFKVSIKNKRDVVLNRNRPQLEFTFKGDRSTSSTPINIDVLVGNNGSILSKGESRALFILCVMFEIESRKKDGKDHLIVFDDVADSFDYKNKYAIIEYLHGLSLDEKNGIHMIVMTHNFDFFRAFRLRCQSHHDKSTKAKIAIRKGKGIITLHEAGSMNEFKRLKKDVKNDNKIFISLIPFARNLIEYAMDAADKDYLKLTNCLHLKTDTASMTTNDIASAMVTALGTSVDLSRYLKADNYLKLVEDEVNDIIANGNEMLIEHKIVLSIAIRLEVEAFIQKTFTNDGSPLLEIPSQTGLWFNQFVQKYRTSHPDALKVLNRAMITTPEAIHFNSFMYEPIMDLSLDDLTKLYSDVKAL